MKRWIFRALFLFLALLVLIILRAPAKHAVAYASPHIAPAVISSPQGSVWHGQAAAFVHPQITLNNLNWDYRALASLLNGPGFKLSGNTANGQFDTIAHLAWSQLATAGSATLGDTQAVIPLADLPLPAIARSIPLTGDLILTLDEAVIDAQWPTEATGRLVLAALQFTDTKVWELGELVADLESVEGGINANLSSDSDYINLQGVAFLGHDGSYRITANLNLDSRLPIVLKTMLIAAGARQADGSTRISYQGQVPRPNAATP